MVEQKNWEEIVGILKNIFEKKGVLMFEFLIEISIPLEDCNISNLDQYIGKNIGILKTDNLNEPYKIKIIEKNGEKKNEKNKFKQNKRKTAIK